MKYSWNIKHHSLWCRADLTMTCQQSWLFWGISSQQLQIQVFTLVSVWDRHDTYVTSHCCTHTGLGDGFICPSSLLHSKDAAIGHKQLAAKFNMTGYFIPTCCNNYPKLKTTTALYCLIFINITILNNNLELGTGAWSTSLYARCMFTSTNVPLLPWRKHHIEI